MSKKIFLILYLFTFPFFISAQTSEHPWNIGLHFGKSEFNGDMGDASYNWSKPFYGFGGISIAGYATHSFDLMANFNYGELGYFVDLDSLNYSNGKFHGSFYGTHADATLFLKYKFNNGYFLKENSRIQPYFLLGAGLSWLWGDRVYDINLNTGLRYAMKDLAAKDFIVSSGLGVNVRINNRFNAYVQSVYVYTDHDGRDGYWIANNDGYLLHQIGMTCNIGKAFKNAPNTTTVASKVECNCNLFDRDSDGIIDKFDLCPDVPGTFQARGCPDRDWDGIPDMQDSCPDVWGLPKFHGCPDTDGDGIPDNLDSCPTIPGPPKFHGCPDTDGDGIPDKFDSCPTVKGLKQFHGCPDTDGDSIPDYLDKCPREAGPRWNQGCPEIKESVKKIFEQALTGIQFQTAKAIILPKSFGILDNVVKVCKENSTYFLIINGHTDSQGDPVKNLKLSDDRANSVRMYLIKKGVSSGRLESHGYGDTLPIDDNTKPEGRAKNRRVEFKVKIIN